jgi:hypothetical protein
MSNDHIEPHLRAILDNIANTHRAAHEELREGMAALNRVNRQTMPHPGWDVPPDYYAPDEEPEPMDRLRAENDRLLSLIADLKEPLEAFCNPDRLREAVMMSCRAHLSHHHACEIIEDDRLGIRAALIKVREL